MLKINFVYIHHSVANKLDLILSFNQTFPEMNASIRCAMSWGHIQITLINLLELLSLDVGNVAWELFACWFRTYKNPLSYAIGFIAALIYYKTLK